MEFKHIPVLLDACIDGLNINPDGIYVDGTAGGGGHSYEIAKHLAQGKGRLISIDRDPEAVAAAGKRLEGLPAKVVLGNYSEIPHILEQEKISGADGILMDLGVSSYQLDNPERGFSYHNDARLDMRMSGEGLSAYDVVNGYSYEALPPKIARKIGSQREKKPVETTLELAEIVKSAVPQKVRREKNPCKKTFQAIRIEVNSELDYLSTALDNAFESLNAGGRLCIITFHSLEDRLVKQRFATFCQGCTCPPEFPVCVCGKTPEGKLVNRKPVVADEKELSENARSRSAKLRIIEKIK